MTPNVGLLLLSVFLHAPPLSSAFIVPSFRRCGNTLTASKSVTSLNVVEGSVDLFDEELRAAMRSTNKLYPDHGEILRPACTYTR